ncbi:hypothetical protein M9458_053362 [Cirrhinus mrigala]|uniref:Retrovirus-related Pol polyprotein from transposon 412 n=1 Tax=Cirrhinus mrigala TaxID=683832 RepID=A0ABD0MTC9_CIRMR
MLMLTCLRPSYPSSTDVTAEWIEIPRSGVRAICKLANAHSSEESRGRLVDQLGIPSESIPPAYVCPIQLELEHKAQLSNLDLRLAQEQDSVIGPVRQEVQKGKVLSATKNSSLSEILLRQQAYPARDQKALTVAKILVEKFFVHYGLPARIHYDQGRDFESKLIKELLEILGIRKSRTSPYHPQGDPQPERFNRTLVSMLGTLDPGKKNKWSQNISQLVHVYNCTKNETTGYSPYYLLFGREARLPVDVQFGTSSEGELGRKHLQYVEDVKKDLEHAYQLSEENSQKTQQRNNRLYDKRQKLPNLPVFRLKPETGTGGVKTGIICWIGEGVRINLPDSRNYVLPTRVTRSKTLKRTQKQQMENKDRREDGREVVALVSDSKDNSMEEYYPAQPGTSYEKLLLSSWESERTKVPSRTTHSSTQNLTEHEVESIASAIPDSVEGLESEGGDHQSLSPPRIDEGERRERPKREVKPVKKLSYNELGKPTEKPLTVVYRGNGGKCPECYKEKTIMYYAMVSSFSQMR